MKWETEWTEIDPTNKEHWAELQKLLDDGWEPFAVTSTDEYFEYHVRRAIYDDLDKLQLPWS